MTVALRIKHRREQLGLRQHELAAISGVSQAQISKYEAGTSEPTAYTLSQLAKALNTSTDWLVGLAEEVNEVSSEEDISIPERQLLQLYRSKSPEMQQKLLDIARVL